MDCDFIFALPGLDWVPQPLTSLSHTIFQDGNIFFNVSWPSIEDLTTDLLTHYPDGLNTYIK